MDPASTPGQTHPDPCEDGVVPSIYRATFAVLSIVRGAPAAPFPSAVTAYLGAAMPRVIPN